MIEETSNNVEFPNLATESETILLDELCERIDELTNVLETISSSIFTEN